MSINEEDLESLINAIQNCCGKKPDRDWCPGCLRKLEIVENMIGELGGDLEKELEKTFEKEEEDLFETLEKEQRLEIKRNKRKTRFFIITQIIVMGLTIGIFAWLVWGK